MEKIIWAICSINFAAIFVQRLRAISDTSLFDPVQNQEHLDYA